MSSDVMGNVLSCVVDYWSTVLHFLLHLWYMEDMEMNATVKQWNRLINLSMMSNRKEWKFSFKYKPNIRLFALIMSFTLSLEYLITEWSNSGWAMRDNDAHVREQTVNIKLSRTAVFTQRTQSWPPMILTAWIRWHPPMTTYLFKVYL